MCKRTPLPAGTRISYLGIFATVIQDAGMPVLTVKPDDSIKQQLWEWEFDGVECEVVCEVVDDSLSKIKSIDAEILIHASNANHSFLLGTQTQTGATNTRMALNAAGYDVEIKVWNETLQVFELQSY